MKFDVPPEKSPVREPPYSDPPGEKDPPYKDPSPVHDPPRHDPAPIKDPPDKPGQEPPQNPRLLEAKFRVGYHASASFYPVADSAIRRIMS